MSELEDEVGQRLSVVAGGLRAEGVVDLLQALHRDVWTQDLDRYEPGELGDTRRSLGFQASENLRELAVQRFREDRAWAIPGLEVKTPQGALELMFRGARVRVMKAGPEHGRSPDWDRLDWGDGSARRLMAQRNSEELGGYWTHRVVGLFDDEVDDAAGVQRVSDFILVWTGDMQEALTAGWLTVPVLGERPFMAQQLLWWDETPSPRGRGLSRPIAPDGDSFEDKPSAEATLKLRPAVREGDS
ncbi:MAG TPA: hypothetical protein VGL36_35825 [Kribbella sp.]